MDTRLLRLAAQIIEKCSVENPADRVLREKLKAARELNRRQSGDISRAVFAYYRWLGWLDTTASMETQLKRALGLAADFQARPETFSDSDLMQRAVPAWANNVMEVTADWCRTLQTEPKLWLRARPGQGRALAAALRDCRAFGTGRLADCVEYFGGEDLFRTREFQAGEFEMQDISSQAVGLVCDPLAGQTWWDVCAGEGGKMLHLADLMDNKGLIWATDRADWRLQKLKRRAARARVFNYRTKLWSDPDKPPTKTKFDGVLVDAPCSGIGTWHRNPQARWTTAPHDLIELSELQRRLLACAASALKVDGKLVYSVCTLARAENEDVVRSFEKEFPNFKPVCLQNVLDTRSAPSQKLCYRPQTFGGNGMFIAAWTRQRDR
jgi:16S rRNA (cytosine967-C5)-methyltransferase